MNDKNKYHEQNKEKLKESQNRYYLKNGKEKPISDYKSNKQQEQARNSYRILSEEKKTEYEKSIATEENWHYNIVVHCT